MSGIATAIAGSAVLGAVSAYNADSPEYSGGGVVTMPQYGFTEPRLELTSDYLTKQLQNLMQGQPPPYLQQYLPTLKKGMKQDLTQNYFGTPGQRNLGGVEMARSAGLSAGLGAKGAVAQSNKMIQDYMNKASQIDRYISEYSLDAMKQSSETVPWQSMQMAQGPNSQVTQPQMVGGGDSGTDWGQMGMMAALALSGMGGAPSGGTASIAGWGNVPVAPANYGAPGGSWLGYSSKRFKENIKKWE